MLAVEKSLADFEAGAVIWVVKVADFEDGAVIWVVWIIILILH